MDSYSLRVANVLVGNSLAEACLEITLGGVNLRTTEDVCIAITGADLNPHIQEKKVPMWSSFVWKKDTLLTFRGAPSGVRSYLAVQGGFRIPSILGSKSTYAPAKLGGYKGRPLQRGDQLQVLSQKCVPLKRKLPSSYIPRYSKEKEVRVILGPHNYYFLKEGVRTFLSSEYVVSRELNRMGMRLSGEFIAYETKAAMAPQAVTFGTIQVPSNGQPIIMLADRQTTGGYPQIATVIAVDHPILAQSLSQDILMFQEVTLQEAQKLAKEQEDFFLQLKTYCFS
jgi:antagonist of KipI